MVKAIFFDVFGTVVDWRKGLSEGIGRTLARFGQDVDAGALADAWAKGLMSGQPRGTPWREACRAALEAALARHADGLPLAERDLLTLERLWERLPPWPDSVPGLRSLRREYVIAACSNAPVATTTWLAKTAGLPFDLVLGADVAGHALPDPRIYSGSAALLDLPPEQVMVVSAHNADLAIARLAGFRTGFFARPREFGPRQDTDLAPAESWNIVAFDLLDLARHLESAVY